MSAAARTFAAEPEPLPNVLFIVADDLGWADVSYHGSALRTPNIDKLAHAGAELDQHYVAPVCTLTRSALMSGRYCSRFGITGPQSDQAFPFGTVTMASALKSRGYETAITGKWHLGSLPECGPRKFGFDSSYGAMGGGTGPWDHRYKKGPYTRNWHRNDEYVDEEGHVTDLIAREAISFLGKPRQKPFFLYLPFTAVHHPLDEPKEWLEANRHIPENRRQYAACVQHMDDAVGRVLAALEKSGKRRNTLIVFTSDNGGMGVPASDLELYPGKYQSGLLGQNEPLRGHKGQLYEGGIRVPAFVNWPGHIPTRKLTAPVHAVDWVPTITGLAGYRATQDLKWDGRNVWPLLAGKAQPAEREFYWKGPGGRSLAVRSGNWKLLVLDAADPAKRHSELYRLDEDPYEERDRSANEPATVARLQDLLRRLQERDNDAVPPRPPRKQ
jgi:arylsulfatase A-like enzyme